MADVNENYKLIIGCIGYANRYEITNLNERFLIRESHDVFVNKSGNTSTRPGYTLPFGRRTVTSKIHSSTEWQTSSYRFWSLREWLNNLEVLYNNVYIPLFTMPSGRHMEFAPWWDATENIDILIGVDGSDTFYAWSGAITQVASITTNTITKKYIVTDTTISFQPRTGVYPLVVPATITKSNGGFLLAGFQVGDTIVVTGSISNDGSYLVAQVTDTILTLSNNDQVILEVAGANITINKQNFGTWAEERFFVLLAGRKVTINGIDYTYTGGENTGTLTGVTPDPTLNPNPILPGAIAIQTMVQTTNMPIAGFQADVVDVLNNQLYVMSLVSRDVYVSHDTDYTNFAFTTPVRIPGEGALLTLDSAGVGLVNQESDEYMTSGNSQWYKTSFTLTADGKGETLTILRLTTADLQAAMSQSFIGHVKNQIMFLSQQKTFDTLGRLQNLPATPLQKPLSDLVLNDFNITNFTGGHVRYFNNWAWISAPVEGEVWIRDLENNWWNPPWFLPVSRFAIINGEFYGHSSIGNETYKLLDGTNDGGLKILSVARFAYRNYGARARLKNFDHYYSELYMTRAAKTYLGIGYEYEGLIRRQYLIDGMDTGIQFINVRAPALGQNPLGQTPLGSNPPSPNSPVRNLRPKYRVIHEMPIYDFFEHFVQYQCGTLDGAFEIIAHGPNAMFSTNTPGFITRDQ